MGALKALKELSSALDQSLYLLVGQSHRKFGFGFEETLFFRLWESIKVPDNGI